MIFVDCPGYGASNLKPPEVILRETRDPHLVLLILNGGETVHDQDVALYKVLASHVKTVRTLPSGRWTSPPNKGPPPATPMNASASTHSPAVRS